MEKRDRQNFPTSFLFLLMAIANPCGRALYDVGLRPIAFGIASSNPAGRMEECLLRVLCVVRERSLRRAEHKSSTECGDSECDHEESIIRRSWPTRGSWCTEKFEGDISKADYFVIVKNNSSLNKSRNLFYGISL